MTSTVLLTAYGPADATFHCEWQETPDFAVSDHLTTDNLFQPCMILLRRSTFDGSRTYDAVKACMQETVCVRPYWESTTNDGHYLTFEWPAELHNNHPEFRINPVLRGKMRLELIFRPEDTNVTVHFVSAGLEGGQGAAWSNPTQSWLGTVPLNSGLSTTAIDPTAVPPGLQLKVLLPTVTDALCLVM